MKTLFLISSFVVPIFLVLCDIWFFRLNTFYLTQLCACAPLLILSWIIGNVCFDYVNTRKVSTHNKSVLITGCDTGFGNLLAQRLVDLGFFVYAGVLFPNGYGAQKLLEKYPTQIKLLKIDVTKKEDVESAAQVIRNEVRPLWAVVNNAGIAIGCPWDWGQDIDQYTKQFEVNLFGVVRVTKNLISLLRQSKGRIVNISSAAGRQTAILMGPYCMTKHSVRVFSDSLRREMVGQGVKVVTIEPTFYSTPITNIDYLNKVRAQIYAQSPKDIIDFYGPDYIQYQDQIKKGDKFMDFLMRSNVNEVVDAMVNAVALENPKPFYKCRGVRDWIPSLGIYFPEIVEDFVMHYTL